MILFFAHNHIFSHAFDSKTKLRALGLSDKKFARKFDKIAFDTIE